MDIKSIEIQEENKGCRVLAALLAVGFLFAAHHFDIVVFLFCSDGVSYKCDFVDDKASSILEQSLRNNKPAPFSPWEPGQSVSRQK